MYSIRVYRRHGPLPREIVRDLLAITRALHRAELGVGAPNADPPNASPPGSAPPPEVSARLARLEEIGHMLRQALELSRVEPNTLGHRAAWSWADKGTTALGDFVATTDAKLGPVVRAAADKLKAG